MPDIGLISFSSRENRVDPGGHNDGGRHQNRREVRQHIEQLPEIQKEIISLSFFKNLPLKTIAEQKGLTLSQTRTLRRNALNTLKKSLNLENLLA
jgi:RNA polymerase sigma factor (sigma-70 family)